MHDDRVLIDYRTADEAGVYKLDETRALVQTVDFFTPIVDDPFTYGQIAAANALSDVYAMGGRPLKPLGTGIIATALKFGRATDAAVAAAIRSMTTLNKAAADVLRALPAGAVHACTAITGFGLLGHASEMAAAGACSIEIDAAAVPLLDGARALVKGNVPGGGRTNRTHFGQRIVIGPQVPDDVVELLFDPQTSGGLLIAIADDAVSDAQTALSSAGVEGWMVGRVVERGAALMTVR